MGRWGLVIVLACACSAPAPARQRAASVLAPKATPTAPSHVTFGIEPRWQPLGAAPFLAARVRMITLEERGTIACAISTDRRVACWGERVGTRHSDVELRKNAAIPYLLAGVDDVVDIAVSEDLLCVARASAPSGCFARWPHIPAPEVTQPVVELGALQRGICARYRDGSIACTDGERSKRRFAPIGGIAGATSLRCWGDDRDGQLGSKRPLGSESLVRVVGLGPPRS